MNLEPCESKKSNIILYEVEESESEDKNENKTDDFKKDDQVKLKIDV